MIGQRLDLALRDAALPLPALGSIAVLNARAGDDLSALPRDRVVAVQGFRPDHDALAAAGFAVAVEIPGDCTAALVCLPRARAAGRGLVAAACTAVGAGGLVLVDGQKTDGAESMLRDLRARVTVQGPVVKAHGKLFWFASDPGAFVDWTAAYATIPGGFVTAPGSFSADGIDPGSALLADALPARMGPRVADLGAGWGYLAAAVLAREGVAEVHLVEADHAALAAARLNIPDPRARFHWADATSFRTPGRVDAVVMNPPFHLGRAADPALGAAFIRAAAAMLTPGGSLWLVANRHLPYDKALAEQFRDIEEIGGTPAFRLTRAGRPHPPARPGVGSASSPRPSSPPRQRL